MAEKSDNNFWGGFILGAIVGGTTAAIVTAVLSKNKNQDPDRLDPEIDPAIPIDPASSHIEPDGDRIRQNLERKIVQLNQAIDAVSQELQSAPKGGNTNNLD
jgi:gas vesicle protein